MSEQRTGLMTDEEMIATWPDSYLTFRAWAEAARKIEAEARRRAIEECAQVCDSVNGYTTGLAANKCAAAIRALR